MAKVVVKIFHLLQPSCLRNGFSSKLPVLFHPLAIDSAKFFQRTACRKDFVGVLSFLIEIQLHFQRCLWVMLSLRSVRFISPRFINIVCDIILFHIRKLFVAFQKAHLLGLGRHGTMLFLATFGHVIQSLRIVQVQKTCSRLNFVFLCFLHLVITPLWGVEMLCRLHNFLCPLFFFSHTEFTVR